MRYKSDTSPPNLSRCSGRELIERLQAKTHCAVRVAGGPTYVNPDGPEAVLAIQSLSERIDVLEGALDIAAGRIEWLAKNADDPRNDVTFRWAAEARASLIKEESRDTE